MPVVPGDRRVSGGPNQGGWRFKHQQEPCRTGSAFPCHLTTGRSRPSDRRR